MTTAIDVLQQSGGFDICRRPIIGSLRERQVAMAILRHVENERDDVGSVIGCLLPTKSATSSTLLLLLISGPRV